MRILLIHNYYRYRGGEDVYFDSIKDLLKKKGHKIYAYTKNSSSIKTPFEKIKTGISMFRNNQTRKELTKIIQNFKPVIAQFQNIYPLITPTAYSVCKQFKVPIIQRISNYRFMCPKGILFRGGKICEECVDKPFYYPAVIHNCYDKSKIASLIFASSFFFHKTSGSFNAVDMFLFPTKFIRDYYVKHFKLDIKKTTIIPTFVNVDHIPKIIPKKKNNYFLYVGRLSEEKGIIDLLNIFTELADINLIVIGDGPLTNNMLLYRKYSNITILKFQERNIIFAYMKKAIATIVPSKWYDVLPHVILESFACNTPVIAPRQKSFTEFINNKNGFLYKNLPELKQKIFLARKQKELVDGMKNNIRENFDNHIDTHYQSLSTIYRRL